MKYKKIYYNGLGVRLVRYHTEYYYEYVTILDDINEGEGILYDKITDIPKYNETFN